MNRLPGWIRLRGETSWKPSEGRTVFFSSHLLEEVERVPEDPYSTTGLRYRQTEDAAVVYSVGMNGTDDGGFISREGSKGPQDIGWRLSAP